MYDISMLCFLSSSCSHLFLHSLLYGYGIVTANAGYSFGCPRKPSRFLAAPVNDKRQLIKGLVLWEMYPSSRLLNQSQPCKGKGIPKACCGSYVLISWILLHQDGDYTGKLWENCPPWIAADSKRDKKKHLRLSSLILNMNKVPQCNFWIE